MADRVECVVVGAGVVGLSTAWFLQEHGTEVTVYDPVPHLITRRAGFERARLIMQSPSRPALQSLLTALTESLFQAAPREVRWHLDVDPIEFD